MKGIKHLIKEILTVMIGILIALFINNWNDERKEKKYLNQVYSSIQNELKENIDHIKKVLPKHQASVDTINVYLNNDRISVYQIIIKANGIHSPPIKTNAWNAIANTKIELIEYNRLSALADVDYRKQNLIKRIEKHTEFIFQNFEETDRTKKEILKMLILDIMGAEKRLQNEMENLIK
ncbi:hypothetical protein BTO06_12220 [Tenacibaculum sp. SZ-18]|uniref:DUF6090 family protein n=1 Tax=Tenacibaculum sp. SZ-18 TaxID=754423 RepID=UPI000C2D2DFF|nr:DUF6090 family protein [Tenacibaculum sp. SZ-18]AUC15869.1 hypothetical protein BTO06_12220 [Tenacibaculum sp. SZ-18]